MATESMKILGDRFEAERAMEGAFRGSIPFAWVDLADGGRVIVFHHNPPLHVPPPEAEEAERIICCRPSLLPEHLRAKACHPDWPHGIVAGPTGGANGPEILAWTEE